MSNSNPILKDIKLNGKIHYCHAIEVGSVYELECVIEQVCSDFSEYTEQDQITFFESMSIYSLSDNDIVTDNIHNFSISDYIAELN